MKDQDDLCKVEQNIMYQPVLTEPSDSISGTLQDKSVMRLSQSSITGELR